MVQHYEPATCRDKFLLQEHLAVEPKSKRFLDQLTIGGGERESKLMRLKELVK